MVWILSPGLSISDNLSSLELLFTLWNSDYDKISEVQSQKIFHLYAFSFLKRFLYCMNNLNNLSYNYLTNIWFWWNDNITKINMICTLPEIVMVTKLYILRQKECVWFKCFFNLNGFIFNMRTWIHHWNLSNKFLFIH